MSDKGFLTHLAGLRGLAILFVVLFHLNGQYWPQGYLGVDVFLVITGYLLFRSRAGRDGTESWRDMLRFCSKRFCRIIPPMVIIILLSMAVGAFFLWWKDEVELSKAAFKACLGTVNLFYEQQFNNYFAADAAFLPLLHLWYLSVTLQVYLIYAVANQALQRLPKRWAVSLLVGAGVVSLALCYSFPVHEWLAGWGLPVWKQSGLMSYYSVLPRLWEVLAGGLVMLLPTLAHRRGLATGLSLASLVILVALALLPWAKGMMPCTLLVVASTVVLLRYTPESRLPWLLGNKIFVWLGGISFSLYLVHMPIIVYGHMWVYGEQNVWVDTLIVVVSVAMGWGFWWCVEKRRFPLWLALALWVAAMGACRIVRAAKGFKAYFPTIEEPVYDQWSYCTDVRLLEPWNSELNRYDVLWPLMVQPRDRSKWVPLFSIGQTSRPASFVLMGDSLSAQLYAGMDTMCRETGMSGVYLSSLVIPFHGWSIKTADDYNFSPEKEKALMEWLSSHPELTHIVIGQAWDGKAKMMKEGENLQKYEDDLRAFLQTLKKMGKKVILVGPTPGFKMHDYTCYFKLRFVRGLNVVDGVPTCSAEELRASHADMYPILTRMEQEGLCSFVDPIDSLAPGEVFSAVKDGVLWMMDDGHIYSNFSIWLMRRLWPQFQQALQP